MKRRTFVSLLGTAPAAAWLAEQIPSAFADTAHPKLGFSIDDLRVERWSRDRDYFVAAAKALGATTNVQSADASEQRQTSQLENLISRNMDALVIVPFNANALTNVVSEAKQANIKTISYDRMILGADIDAYVSFDNVRVGQMQAQAVVDVKPKGNYFLLGGAPTDNNAKLLRQGQMKVLQPLIDRGDIKIVGARYVPEWSPSQALSIIEDALTAQNNKIDGIVASNDGVAGGAIQALQGQGLAGKVPVSGQDSDLAAIKRILDGTQTSTVYKPLKQIASTAAQTAVQLVRGEKPPFNAQINNGVKNVDTILLTPILITRENVHVLVRDGFYTAAQLGMK
ncbi:D-xylose ABC transporter substrate-binding protein [Tanticharoenia sakaeratensis]|uniref:D-xylose ABC transporter, D-xylose-binding protein n=1 Tax=Tanticharoenia sakaeratensis NBRC 103193 TaxID=1231623 RepID=A0A0D6MKE8_9PROT|nr:D-xylose ABC transporter substrate-binding protein [Tanticharoenia sakaeratensis]GAN53951.1 D-xylose ABC transporter, D-xylose-binding protein [Tanticharoenia sakaeratensis NBRC 103193]